MFWRKLEALPTALLSVIETATAAAILVVAVMATAFAILDLVAVVDEQTDTGPTWNNRVRSCRTRIAEAVPLTSIKIILVAWQIITQV